MYRFFCCLLICILLFTGCSRTAAPASPDASDPPSPTQDPPGEVDKETAQKLFESYILPYEAVTGGMPFSHPSELSNDLVVCLSIHRLVAENGEHAYRVQNDSGDDWSIFPRTQVEQTAASLFGFSQIGALDPYSDFAYYNTFDPVEEETGGVHIPETSSALTGYAGEIYGSSIGTLPELRPTYDLLVTGCEVLTDGGISVTAARKTGDFDLPELVYTFSPSPEGDWQYRSAEARVDESFTAIRTPEQLVRLSRMVNAGDRSYLGQTFRLEADLDMSGIDIEPIGSFTFPLLPESRPFDAVFEGNGHTISNLTLSCPGTSPFNEMPLPTGLFGSTGRRSVIQDLHLQNVHVSGESSVGGLAGSFMGRLYNCSVEGSISGISDVGGLVGSTGDDRFSHANEAINCHTDVTVDGREGIGGLFGMCYYTWVEGCSAEGTVRMGTGEPGYVRNAGGLIGHLGAGAVSNCFSSALLQTLDPNSRAVGGLVGLNEHASILQCYVQAEKSGQFPPVAGSTTGFFDAAALSASEYDAKRAELLPEGYRKRSEITGVAFNNKLYLTGAVGFPEGDTLAVLIRHPDERTLRLCQDYEPVPISSGGETALLMPVHDGTILALSDYRFDGGEYQPNDDPFLIRDYTGAAARNWYGGDSALLLEYDPPRSGAPGLLITATHDGKTAAYSYHYDPAAQNTQMQIIYITP